MSDEFEYQRVLIVEPFDESTTVIDLEPTDISDYQHFEQTSPDGFWNYCQCDTGRTCLVWTIPLVLLAIGMWIATGFIVHHISNSATHDGWAVGAIAMFIGSLVMTCISVMPWFELIRQNMIMYAVLQELAQA